MIRIVLVLILALCAAPGLHGQSEPEADLVPETPKLHFGVYADAGYSSGSTGAHDAFSVGALDLYSTAMLSDRWSALVEVVFENVGGESIVDVERVQATYSYSDALRVTVGRVHNPIIRWSVAQHHGLYVQTPIDRPAISNWEDEPGLWPVHMVGVAVSGRMAGTTGLGYFVAVANGRGRVLDEIQTTGDADGSKAAMAAVTAAPAAIPGLELALAWYRDRIPAASGRLKESDFTASLLYDRGPIEVRAEWAQMTHSPESGPIDYKTSGWYILGAWRLPGKGASLKPYVLLDRLDADQRQAFLEDVADVSAWAAGIRWDTSQHVALKGDYRSDRRAGGGRDGAARVQLALSF